MDMLIIGYTMWKLYFSLGEVLLELLGNFDVVHDFVKLHFI